MLQRKPFVASLRNLTVFLPAGRLRENGKTSSAYFLDYYQNMVKRGATNIMASNRSVAKKLQETIPSENITLVLVQDIPIIIRTQEMALIFGTANQDD